MVVIDPSLFVVVAVSSTFSKCVHATCLCFLADLDTDPHVVVAITWMGSPWEALGNRREVDGKLMGRHGNGRELREGRVMGKREN